MRKVCLSCVSTTTSHVTTSPTVLTPRYQILTRTVTKGWVKVFIFDFKLTLNNFQYGLKQALQLLIYTLITVVVVMFVAGEDGTLKSLSNQNVNFSV